MPGEVSRILVPVQLPPFVHVVQGFANVDFVTKEALQKAVAMDGVELEGKRLIIAVSRGQGRGGTRGRGRGPDGGRGRGESAGQGRGQQQGAQPPRGGMADRGRGRDNRGRGGRDGRGRGREGRGRPGPMPAGRMQGLSINSVDWPWAACC